MDFFCTCHEVMRDSGGGTLPRISNLDTGWWGVVSLTPRLDTVCLWIVGGVGPDLVWTLGRWKQSLEPAGNRKTFCKFVRPLP